ncbi:hypothetical protein BVRB_9g225750 [Beta vulgaris subsp. vulgaris]|uniref:Uncharacterized protein n=1 Tax=Beta vulgaris subsp. vulgaris TaxID=3555 RepID=A0A0J8DZS4_BETVV|nr:hypothetical protein BVRB_9g225750 [Beta vulgaris subsp. vulgaris]
MMYYSFLYVWFGLTYMELETFCCSYGTILRDND